MKSCDEVLELLPDVAPTLAGEALAVREHLALCPDCAEAAEAYLLTVDALRGGAAPGVMLGPEFAARILAALPAPLPVEGAPNPRPHAGGRLRLVPRAAAAAALFAAGVLAGPVLRGGPGATAGPVSPRQAPIEGALPAEREARERVTAVVGGGALDAPGRLEDAAPEANAPGVASARFEVDARAAALAYRGDPLRAYVSEAGLVLEAVHDLDGSDPRALRLLARHVRGRALVETGDRLLVALERSPARQELEPLQPLIRGAQLILRKVRHAAADGSGQAASTLQREVEQTGILDAYRSLLTAQPVHDPAAAPATNGPL